MIFNQPQQPIEQQDRSARRLSSLTKLIAVFESTFPSVHYRILEQVSAVNAQASLSNGKHLVDIFGGLAFHPVIRHDGLIFTLLHETGHHLGQGCKSSPDCKLPWAQLACECSADRWAITDGRRALRANGADFRLTAALQQIEQAVAPKTQKSSKASVRTKCWSLDWHKRKQTLLQGQSVVLRRAKFPARFRADNRRVIWAH
jgi:hypothetical protein